MLLETTQKYRVDSEEQAKDLIEQELDKPLPPEYPDGYLFITMGAGDNWPLGRAIFEGGTK